MASLENFRQEKSSKCFHFEERIRKKEKKVFISAAPKLVNIQTGLGANNRLYGPKVYYYFSQYWMPGCLLLLGHNEVKSPTLGPTSHYKNCCCFLFSKFGLLQLFLLFALKQRRTARQSEDK